MHGVSMLYEDGPMEGLKLSTALLSRLISQDINTNFFFEFQPFNFFKQNTSYIKLSYFF